MKYRYIIVGAGSAGSVLSNRLTENFDSSVLLLEAGKADKKQEIHIPLAFSKLFHTEYDWSYYTEPQTELNNRKIFYPRGKTLGGTSSINAMIYIRGHRQDYERWSKLGNEGWSFAEVLPYFKKAENYQQKRSNNSNNYGLNGYLSVSNRRYTNCLSQTFIEAAREIGIPTLKDLNCSEPEGVGLYPVTQFKGQRHSTAKAYLKPIINRKNLTIRTEAQVTRLLWEELRIIGVEYLHQGKLHQVKATQEVILCGGAINSPQLLMLSGIGNGSHLQKLGIPVIVDLPGVGKNLQDHLAVGISYQCNKISTLDNALTLGNWLQYLLFKKGPFTSNVAEAGGFIKTQVDLQQSDLQFHFTPGYFILDGDGFIKSQGQGFTIAPTLIKPKSRGQINLSSSDPFTAPRIQPNYLTHEADWQVLIQGLKLSRQIVNTAAFEPFRGDEYLPGDKVRTDEDFAQYIRESVSTIYHPVGTCKMGKQPMGVVNSNLQVHGVEGLRVVDASIMPDIVSGNTNAPTIMIAEKAADLIKQNRH